MKTSTPALLRFLALPMSIAALFWAAHAHAANAHTYTPNGDPNLPNNALDELSNPVTLWSVNFGGGTPGTDDGSYADGTSDWGLWSTNDQATAITSFDGGALSIGQTVSFGFYNGYINNQVGFDLLNSSDQTVLSVWFHGGDSDYSYYDGGGAGTTGYGYNLETFLPFSFTLTGADTYSATFATSSWSGTLNNGGGDVTGLDWYNNALSADHHDVKLDDYSISPVPEPGQVALVAMAGAILIVHFGRRRAALR